MEFKVDFFNELEKGVCSALETYSNVHRGSGFKSLASTVLYDKARDIVLEYLGLPKENNIVIFCTTERAGLLIPQLNNNWYQLISGTDLGLSLGVSALVTKKSSLSSEISFYTGGGTTRLVSRKWVIWANAPDRFEAGTPAIINVIAFTKALKMAGKYGNDIFRNKQLDNQSALNLLYTDELDRFSGRKMFDELRKTLIGREVPVPTENGIMPFINFDNGASTPTFMPVWKVFCATWRQQESFQKEIIKITRELCLEMLGASGDSYELFFTSNTTDAINIVAGSPGLRPDSEIETVVLGTLLEHNSNDLPWRFVPGLSLIRLGIDNEGFVDLKELETILDEYNQKKLWRNKRIRLVTITGASNVLGVYNDLTEISRIVHHYGALLMVDAAQMVAHRKVEMEATGIDYLAFSAHKVYAPFGTGVLIARKGLLNFSSEESDRINASGEENAAGIAALGKSLVLLRRVGMDLIRNEEQELTEYALREMTKIKDLRIFGIKEPGSLQFKNKGGVIVFDLKNLIAGKIAKELAWRGGIGVRYGCHCAHLLIKKLANIPPPLEGFQGFLLRIFPKMVLPGITRISLGIENTKEEIDRLVIILRRIAGEIKPEESAMKQKTVSRADVQKQIDNLVNETIGKVFN